MLRTTLRPVFAVGLLLSYGCAEGDSLTGGGSTNDGAGSQGGDSGDGGAGTTSSSSSSTSSSTTGSSSSSSSSSSSTGGGGGGTGGGDACGNGAVDTGEDCDGQNLDGATCTTIGQGFVGGSLSCAADCTFDVTACTAPPTCGNGAIEGNEECDGASLGGATCTSLGHDAGTLTCAANCSFNEAPCTDCGDGVREGAEVCDGANLNGQTCQSQGFTGGTLACNASCSGYNTAGCTTACTPVNLLTNGGFDNGPFGGGWTESSLNFGTPVCDVAGCGLGGGTGPHQGTYWVWFGGTNTAFESASVSRSVVINPGMATLSFQLDIPVCEDPAWALDQLTVTIDGNILFQTTNLDAGCGAVGYQQLSFDISAYANGQAHTITFAAQTDDFFDVTNFMIDTVELLGCP
jgi:hypothetical protein